VAGAAHIVVVVVVAPVVASTVVAPAFLAPPTSLEAAATAVSLLPVAATAVPVRVLLAHRVVALHPTSAIIAARVAVPAVAAAVPVAAAPLPATEPAATVAVAVLPTAVRLLVRLLLEETLQLRLYHMHRARQPELRFERRPDLGCEPLLNREHRVERVPSERLRGHWTRWDRDTRTGPASKERMSTGYRVSRKEFSTRNAHTRLGRVFNWTRK
jgi:hypothetical protein